MTSLATTEQPRSGQAILWAIAAAALGLVMASPESFWIDELATMTVAEQPNIGSAAEAILWSDQSESQMPGYLFYAWAWRNTLGSSEWSLRLSNVPWLAIAAWALARTAATLQLNRVVPWLLVQPFLWNYVDEFRPYCMQIAGGAMFVLAISQYVAASGTGRNWAVTLSAAALVTCTSSMLGAVATFFVYLALIGVGVRRRWPLEKRAIVVLAVANFALAILGAYYAWTLQRGAGGAQLWKVGAANVALTAYEFAGFSGLGPGRDEIRDAARGGAANLRTLFQPFAVGLCALAAAYAVLMAFQASRAARSATADRRLVAGATLFVLIASVLGMLGLAVAAQWPFWGRHMAPVFAFWVLLLALMVDRAEATWIGRGVSVGLFALLLVSSVLLRFSPAHGHDDYRGATALLGDALGRGDHVWWTARDLAGSELYGEAFDGEYGDRLVALHGVDADRVATLPFPQTVFLSKPDVYDEKEAVTEFLIDNRFKVVARLQGFEVWRVVDEADSSTQATMR